MIKSPKYVIQEIQRRMGKENDLLQYYVNCKPYLSPIYVFYTKAYYELIYCVNGTAYEEIQKISQKLSDEPENYESNTNLKSIIYPLFEVLEKKEALSLKVTKVGERSNFKTLSTDNISYEKLQEFFLKF